MYREAAAAGLACVLICFSNAAFQASEDRGFAHAPKLERQEQIAQWFARYDSVRHDAQMSESERGSSQRLLTRGLASRFILSADSARDKAAANALLQNLVQRYHTALAQLSSIPELAQTRQLHRGYMQYFASARDIFSDYLKVQDNLFAVDGNGGALLGRLQERKADLEKLDQANKELDTRLRLRYHVPPYAW